MSTDYRSVFERYLDVVASAEAMGGQVELPDQPQQIIQPGDLERALNNPRSLFPSTDQGELRERLRLLCTFALWLRYSPPGHAPVRLASRAARLRFAVWTLPPRMRWQEWRSLTLEGAAPAGVLLLMTGWSLPVGLAAQILWDDRPVTAPLGRLRRMRGSTS
ncbi:MAG: hypothetical protein ACRDTG_27965 [Pseudonocardiaceae bacterium]